MSFYDYRDPIEYVVDRYFERKRFISSNTENLSMSQLSGVTPDDSLPSEPCYLVRDEQGKVSKVIYGDFELLQSNTENEFDPVVWQEELIRENGKVEGVTITYPNGETVTNKFKRNDDGKLEKVIIEP